MEDIFAVPTRQYIIPRTADEDVIATEPIEGVIATESTDYVVTRRAVENVIARGAGNRTITIETRIKNPFSISTISNSISSIMNIW